MDSNFQTPIKPPAAPTRGRKRGAAHLRLLPERHVSPFVVPPSPMLAKLGVGTGVSVFRLERRQKEGTGIGSGTAASGGFRSPWAVKRLQTRAPRILKKRLKQEAALLQSFDHPNIVAYRAYSENVRTDETFSKNSSSSSKTTLEQSESAPQSQFDADADFKPQSDADADFKPPSAPPRKRAKATKAKAKKASQDENTQRRRRKAKSKHAGPVLAMEDCRMSLWDVIKRRKEAGRAFTASEILRVVFGVSCALDYLHREKKILHGDIKSNNILVGDDSLEFVKVCDFGVSLKLKDDLSGLVDPTPGQYIGTPAWSAPEAVDGEIQRRTPVSAKTDIYALGCVIFEMLTLDVPHAAVFEDFDTGDMELATEIFNDAIGKRPDLPDEISEDLHQFAALFHCCTHDDPDERPSAVRIISAMGSV